MNLPTDTAEAVPASSRYQFRAIVLQNWQPLKSLRLALRECLLAGQAFAFYGASGKKISDE